MAASGAILASTVVGVGTAQAGTHHAPKRTSHIRQLLTPPKKYYGVYVSQAPASMAPINKVTQETGKQPNMSLFYNAWNSAAAAGYSNVNVTAIQNACNAGMLPMLTWESWDTSVTGPHGPAWSQPDFAPSVIANGKYDAYIRASAEKIKATHCPVALRLDQEDNGSWYPWGIATAGMHNSAADYVAMWRHVWGIFNSVGASNVLWVWSPNVQSAKHPNLPALSASYPGGKYVDWVGIDGYMYNNPAETFHDRFQPTFDQLRAFVPNTPWIIGEVGVGSGSSKPAQLKNVVSAVARRKRLVGMNYFDTNKSTDASNWTLDETQESLAAFRTAIANPVFASGTPGKPPGQ
jgi:hypothetical protein